MNRATPKMRRFAGRLIADETHGRNGTAETMTPAVAMVCDKLRSHFVTFMGATGFQALLSRSLALAITEVPWLRAVRVTPGGTLEGLDDLKTQVSREEIDEDSVVLVATLLGLMTSFIGEKLTVRMVREVWPRLPLEESDFSTRDGDIK